MLEFMLGMGLGAILGVAVAYALYAYTFYQLAVDSSWREWIDIRDELRSHRAELAMKDFDPE